jgi:hypothetical protein
MQRSGRDERTTTELDLVHAPDMCIAIAARRRHRDRARRSEPASIATTTPLHISRFFFRRHDPFWYGYC